MLEKSRPCRNHSVIKTGLLIIAKLVELGFYFVPFKKHLVQGEWTIKFSDKVLSDATVPHGIMSHAHVNT